MVWRGFSACGQAELTYLRGKQASNGYIETISSIFPLFAKIHHENDFDLHQDKPQKRQKEKLSIMEWPACSAYLNPTANVWGTLTRHVRSCLVTGLILTDSSLTHWRPGFDSRCGNTCLIFFYPTKFGCIFFMMELQISISSKDQWLRRCYLW